MKNNNEQENLIQNGYIESGTLVINVDDITKMTLTEEQVKQEAAKQNVRYDKGVVIVDKNGNTKKVSSLLFGYNKHNVQLADGNYANADELLNAINEAINKLDAGSIVVDKKGKVLNPEELIGVVKEASGKIKVGERSEKISNQDSRNWSVQGAHDDIEHKKGVVFLGNDDVVLKAGDYISVNELMVALNEYVIATPSMDIIEATPNLQQNINERTMVKVTHKYKDNMSKWLAFLAALTVLLSGLRLKDNIKTVVVPEEYKLEIMNMIEKKQLDYTINGMNVEFTQESIEKAQQKIVSKFKIGEPVALKDGDKLYENSELGGKSIEIGNGMRQAGDYAISGVSIIYNGNIFKSHVDTNIQNPGFEIGKFINETCEKHNLDPNLIDVRLHMGNEVDFTRAGWIDISNLIKAETISPEMLTQTTTIASTYKGTIEDFQNSTITIDTVNGPTTINVKDENGNLIAPGSIVIGSDGKEYQIENLQTESNVYEEIDTFNLEGTTTKQIVDGKKLTWSIKDCSLAFGLAPLLGAIASTVKTKKKNEQLEQNPAFLEFQNESEYQEFKKKFEESKEQYEKTSGFKKMIKRIFYRKELDTMQQLTAEQQIELQSIIRKLNENNSGDKYEFQNGRIVLTTQNGLTRDITDSVMPHIWQIGKENEITAEGRLEIEKKEISNDGIHKR